MRVALYARYSSEMQSDRSAADQIDALRAAVAARGWTEVGVYSDEAISGAALPTRPGVQALMRAAANGGVDVVLTEALDRLSRGQSDTARLFELLSFYGVRLETLGAGHITELHVGLEGTMNRLFVVELAKKTRRGLIGRVNAGFSAGGRCYGYDVAGKGLLAINEDQAAVVRGIFAAYAAGDAPRTIAHRLNAEHEPGPRGGTWSPSAIAGDRRAGDGILCQELYVGVRVFNRRRFRKHPETGKRSSVLNPPEQWIRKAAPELRILDDDLWSRVQARAGAISAAPAGQKRKPKRLLSGLIRCVLCGGSMTLQGGKYACANHRERGTCPNSKIIRAETVEARVLEGVRTRLLAPEVIARAVRTYQRDQEQARLSAERTRGPMERELAEIARRISRAADSYERGVFEVEELRARVEPLKARRAELQAALAAVDKPQPVRMHPRAADFYRDLTEDLAGALNAEDGDEGRDLVRSVIERVDFHSRPGLGNFTLEVHGKLAALLGISERAAALTSDCEVGLGAGTRSGSNLTPLHLSFAA